MQDIFTLFHLDRPFKFVSKTSNFFIPIVGWSMFLTGQHHAIAIHLECYWAESLPFSKPFRQAHAIISSLWGLGSPQVKWQSLLSGCTFEFQSPLSLSYNSISEKGKASIP